jgi:hypothetical protein
MKYIKVLILVASLMVTIFFNAFSADAAVKVKGYFRKDGTYVQPHYRSNPDGSPYNNYSFPGNTNPYTGVTSGGSVDTYLKNYSSGSIGSIGSGSTYSYTAPTTALTTVAQHVCPANSTWGGSSCACDTGYTKSTLTDSCITFSASCIEQHGSTAFYDSNNKTCYFCPSGYAYNRSDNSCSLITVPSPSPIPERKSCFYGYGWSEEMKNCIALAPGIRPSDDVPQEQTKLSKKFVTTIWRTNIRLSPSTNAAKLGTSNAKMQFELLGDNGEWMKVQYGSKEGWIRKDLLTIN